MYLLDTNVLSEFIRPRPDPGVVARLRTCRREQLFASVVTRYELRHGAALRDDEGRLWSRLAAEILPLVDWLAVDEQVAERAGEISALQRRRGRPCGALDPLLAATAQVHRLQLVTRNLRHFADIPGLAVENWFAA